MATLSEEDLKLFADAVRDYFTVTTRFEAEITSAYLGTTEVPGHEFTGVITLSGHFEGHVIVSASRELLRELLVMQGEKNISDPHLLDAVGELANTVAGNARRHFGSDLQISVPVKLSGPAGIRAKVRERPFVITLRWGKHPAMVCVDMERRA